MYKRLTMLILTGIMTVGAVTFQIPCTAQTVQAGVISYKHRAEGIKRNTSKQVVNEMWRLQQRLKDTALNGGGFVDLSDINEDAIAWYFSGGQRYNCITEDNLYFGGVAQCSLFYDSKKAEISVADVGLANKVFAELDSVMDAFRSGLSNNMSDLDKVLYINEFLHSYKETCEKSNKIGDMSIVGRYFLGAGNGDCSVWYETSAYLGRMCGLVSDINADGYDHIWNVVRVDGDYYHCDFYWGYIMQSDVAITRLSNHENYSPGVVCDNIQYDGKYGDTSSYPSEFFKPVTKLSRNLTLSRQSFTINTGDTYQLSYGNFPFTSANNKMSVSWTSSSPSVATVSNGKVTGVSAGTATITAKTVDGLTASCTVTVSSKGTSAKPSVDPNAEIITITLWASPTQEYGKHKIVDIITNIGYSTYGAVESLPTPTMDGYKFVGWYTYSGDRKVTDDTAYTSQTVVSNLYAKWEKDTSSSSKTITYTIKFNGNGATSGSMPAMKSCKTGTKYKLTANKFVRKGYKFIGWSTSKGGSVKYKNKAVVKNLTTKNGSTVTLYAVWKKI